MRRTTSSKSAKEGSLDLLAKEPFLALVGKRCAIVVVADGILTGVASPADEVVVALGTENVASASSTGMLSPGAWSSSNTANTISSAKQRRREFIAQLANRGE
jgi:hypothetical protein